MQKHYYLSNTFTQTIGKNVFNILLLCILLIIIPSLAQSKQNNKLNISDIRLWTAPDHTRLVFDLDGKVNYRVMRLEKPSRVVLDIQNTAMKKRLSNFPSDHVVKSISYGSLGKNVLRIILEVKGDIKARSFLLEPSHGKPYRLVVDCLPATQLQKITPPSTHTSKKSLLIAVDAGHGGEDPGAIGPGGIHEKQITLAIAKKLAASINARPGMRAMLTRKGDYYVGLKKRVALARKAKADLFISIHADSLSNRRVSGSSVYTITEKGASDKMAKLLAQKENAADIIGGVNKRLRSSDPVVNMILADLTKRDSMNGANVLANEILLQIRRQGGIIKHRKPKHARFAVLGAIEIPSVLVEVDYISNPDRERKLQTSRYQQQLATAIRQASELFFRKQGRLNRQVSTITPSHRPKTQTRVARAKQKVKRTTSTVRKTSKVNHKHVHIVKAKETLYRISINYHVDITSLRNMNKLASNNIRIGQRLLIPTRK
ncbi:MAG: N-acetylmuramoyl-L-alanine amidase [Mariprofundales bacterium]